MFVFSLRMVSTRGACHSLARGDGHPLRIAPVDTVILVVVVL
jgi:hypothetical protein